MKIRKSASDSLPSFSMGLMPAWRQMFGETRFESGSLANGGYPIRTTLFIKSEKNRTKMLSSGIDRKSIIQFRKNTKKVWKKSEGFQNNKKNKFQNIVQKSIIYLRTRKIPKNKNKFLARGFRKTKFQDFKNPLLGNFQ